MQDFLAAIIKQLSYFEQSVVALRPPAPMEAIKAAEHDLGCHFGPQLKDFLRTHNGGRIIEISLRGVQLLGQEKIPSALDIAAQNLLFRSHQWWPANWLEVGSNGFGDYFVADTSKPNSFGEYPILLVDHEALGRDGLSQRFAESYFDFLERVVREMIGLYESSGNLKGH